MRELAAGLHTASPRAIPILRNNLIKSWKQQKRRLKLEQQVLT